VELNSLLYRKQIDARTGYLCLFCWVSTVAALAQSAPQVEPLHKMTDAQTIQDLGKNVDRLAAQDKFSGAVLVAKGNKILFEHAYGYADHAFNVLNKVDTKFNLGSMGKMFTGVAVLQLAQEGKLSLDDKLIKDMPDYPNKDVANQITIRQLLTHTSGLGDFFGPEFIGSSMAKFDTLESLLPLFVDKPLQSEPGAKWSYSNAGFIVLGLVIQHVSGESYYDYVRTHIFEPAGMTNTGNFPWDADVPDRAMGYMSGGSPGAPRKSNIFVLQRGGSAGGGYSTVGDLLKFATALEEGKLLNKTYTDMDMTGQVATSRLGVKYGFGMEESFVNGVRIVGHAGGGPGINSNLDIYPGLGYTVAIMSNYDNAMPLVNQRLQIELTGESLPKAVQLSPDVLKSFAGTYRPAAVEGLRITPPPLVIMADEQGLWLQFMGPKRRFVPASPETFFDPDLPNTRLDFAKDEKGQITDLTATRLGSPAPIKAVKEP
jgi:CubicO group peptidase (beta-lactamase class C family)